MKKGERALRKEKEDVEEERQNRLRTYDDEDAMIKARWAEVEEANTKCRGLQSELAKRLRNKRVVVSESEDE